jgi:hypothetical protein
MTAAASSPAPWYRQRWPWLLIAGPGIVVVAATVTAYLAWSTDDGVIAEDYYKRGLLINRELARTGASEALHLGAVVRVGPDGSVTVVLSSAPGTAVAPPSIRLRLTHPTRSGHDRAVLLTRAADGLYRGQTDLPAAGRWLVTVETDTWRLPTAATKGNLDEVRLGAAEAAN